MMRVSVLLVAFVVIVTGPGWRLSPVMADELGNSPGAITTEPATMDEMPLQIVRSSAILGKNITNAKGEAIGRLQDIVLTPDQTSASYVVLRRGGFLSIGGQVYAVPWTAITISSDGKTVTTGIVASELNKESSFSRTAWPDVGETRWSEMPYYSDSMQTFNPDEGTFQLRRVSRITALNAGNRQGQFLGNLNDLGIERASGRVVYGVVSLGGGLLEQVKLAAIPWDMVILQSSPAVAGINLTRNQLESVAFEKTRWPNWGDRSYSLMLYNSFGEQPGAQVYGYATSEERGGMTEPWVAGSDYNSRFNASTIETIHGTVQKVGTFRPASHAVSGLLLTVSLPDGRTVMVQGGPKPYVTRTGFAVMPGMAVYVSGSKATIGGQDVLMASEISTATSTLRLRDSSGVPVWTSKDLSARFPAPAGAKEEPSQSDYPGGDMGY